MKKEIPNFIYQGTFEFDPNVHVFPPEEIEKKKDEKAILPLIEKLKKELKSKKKKNNQKERMKEIDMTKNLFQQYQNMRFLKFQLSETEIFPKEVRMPKIYRIQSPEPHTLYTDLFDEPQEWYSIKNFIEEFAIQSYLTYEVGMWLASISSAVNCCEYILKYEYLRILNKEDAKKLNLDRNYTLGYFLRNDNNALKKLKIKTKFYDKIDYINCIRSTLYHFNSQKFKKVKNKGKIEVEKNGDLDSEMSVPIFAYRVYQIMLDLINHFYSKEKQLEYILECRKDWQKKRNIKE